MGCIGELEADVMQNHGIGIEYALKLIILLLVVLDKLLPILRVQLVNIADLNYSAPFP
jgi:hypothetical protein